MGLCSSNNIGGIEIYMRNQYYHLDKSKFRYDFIHVLDEPMAFEKDFYDSTIYSLPERRYHPLKYYWHLIKLFLNIRQKDYKVIIVNMGTLSHALPLMLAKLINIPVRIAHAHASGNEKTIGILRKTQYYINSKIIHLSVTDYWACSRDAGKYMFGNIKSLNVVHNGFDTKRFAYNPYLREIVREKYKLNGKIVLGHVGRFSPVKNHLFLLDMLKEIITKHNNVMLLLVGDDSIENKNREYLKELRDRIKKYNLEKNVIFTGFSDDVEKYYNAMDIFLLPSFSEGLPYCVLEAQASGLPCLLSEGIPKEAAVLPSVSFLSINDLEAWGLALENIIYHPAERQDKSSIIKKAGFDVINTTRMVESCVYELVKKYA